jgi:ferric-dicitrate binding protein FerR (iron transport regulator)/predicted negative regulator of RcsB-dependent stress response
MPSDRSCARVREQLLDAEREGRLDDAVEEHLRSCLACGALHRELSVVVQSARRLATSDPLPAGFEAESLDRLLPALEREERQRRRWQVGWLAAGVTAAAAATIVVVLLVPAGGSQELGESLTAGVSRWQGDATYSQGGEETRRMTRGVRLRENDELRVGESGRVAIELGDDLAVALESTQLVLERFDRHRVRLRLRRGAVAVRVKPRPESSPPFCVSVDGADVFVVGTEFAVRASGDRSEVSVAAGRVRVVLARGAEQLVSAGETLRLTRAGGERGMLTVAQQSAMAAALQPSSWPAKVAPEVDSAAADRAASDSANEPEQPAPARHRRRRSVEPREPAAIPATLLEAATGGRCAAAEGALAELSRKLGRPERARAHVVVADCYNNAGDPNAALRLYRDVARRFSSTLAAANATYETGRILVRLEKPAQAERAFADYVAANPRGALAAEARYRICSLQLEQEKHDAALACLRAFRRSYAHHRRSRQTYLLEATILRVGKKDCRAAIVAYDAYLEQPGELAAQAKSWRQWCRERSGE